MLRRGLLTALLLALITLLAIGPASARSANSVTTASLPPTPATPTLTPAPALTPAAPVVAPPVTTVPSAPAPAPAPQADPAAALPSQAADAATASGGDDPGTGDLVARVNAALDATVPSAWRAAIPVQVSIISGSTSWSFPGGSMRIASYHATGSWSHLLTVVAHEFGHQIAFADGTQAYLGAPPAGWPYADAEPAEAWADCVSLVFTGISDPSHGLGTCPPATLAWTATWLTANA